MNNGFQQIWTEIKNLWNHALFTAAVISIKLKSYNRQSLKKLLTARHGVEIFSVLPLEMTMATVFNKVSSIILIVLFVLQEGQEANNYIIIIIITFFLKVTFRHKKFNNKTCLINKWPSKQNNKFK